LDCILVSTGPGIRVGVRGRDELASADDEADVDMFRSIGAEAEGVTRLRRRAEATTELRIDIGD
jgi:hypothetical protein